MTAPTSDASTRRTGRTEHGSHTRIGDPDSGGGGSGSAMLTDVRVIEFAADAGLALQLLEVPG